MTRSSPFVCFLEPVSVSLHVRAVRGAPNAGCAGKISQIWADRANGGGKCHGSGRSASSLFRSTMPVISRGKVVLWMATFRSWRGLDEGPETGTIRSLHSESASNSALENSGVETLAVQPITELRT